MAKIGLSKHEGAGNDFLVMLDLEDRVELSSDEVRWLADRHRGLGADGVITVTGPSGGGEITMRLANQDGSPAEISGNGLRCLAQAAVRAGVVAEGRFSVMTGAGLREVSCELLDETHASCSAAMGACSILEIDLDARSATVDVGNPHLVMVVDDLDAIDVETDGAALQVRRPGGINVEWVTPGAAGALQMLVFERGVGPTLACGSGACAVAATARAFGIGGDVVEVTSPGGTLRVALDGDDAVLSGPVTVIADIVVNIERDA